MSQAAFSRGLEDIHVLEIHAKDKRHTSRSNYVGKPVTQSGCAEEREGDNGEVKINSDKI